MKIHPYPLLLTLCLLISLSTSAQNRTGLLRAQVSDAQTGAALPYATMTVLRPDSSLAGGGIADDAGNLQVSVPYGTNYTVLLQFMGYDEKRLEQVTVDSPEKDLGTISLGEAAQTLMEVEVEAQQMEMQLSLDKKVFNVSDNLATKGGSATDILENIPSVAVDVEGNVSLRGSEDVRILIDGKPSGLTGASALRQLPSDIIERVEVITNPSARYEAQGMAGIINIVLKKNRRDGLNGSFELNTGWPHNHGLGANLNMRREKMNLFVNLGTRYRINQGGGYNNSTFTNQVYDTLDNDYAFTFLDRNQTRTHERGGWSHNLRIGSDFYLTDKDVLTASFLYNHQNEENEAHLNYDYLGAGDELNLYSRRTDNEEEIDKNLEWSLDYRRTYEEKDKALNVSLQYRDNVESESSNFVENYFLPSGELAQATPDRQQARNEEKNEEMLLQLDFIDPLPNDRGQWEVGARSSLRNIGNDYGVSFFRDGEFQPLEPFSNEFNYEEQVHAAYAQAGFKFDRFSYQGGLRAEYSLINTFINENGNPREFFNLFPSAFVTYKLSDLASLQASYSRRIRRPGFRRLNPFLTFSDARNLRLGNPNLNPEFTDSYELGYLRNWAKLSLTSSIFYRHSTDGIQYISSLAESTEELEGIITGGPITQSRPYNVSDQNDLGVEFVLSADLLPWWTLNGSVNFFHSETKPFTFTVGDVTESEDGVKTWASQGRISSRMKFGNGLNLQQMLFYRAPQNNLQGRRRSITFLSVGASKDILNKKGTLSFTIDDVLNTRKWRSETQTAGFSTDSEFQWRKRSARLTFTYRLRQENRRQNGKRPQQEQEGDDGEMMEY